MDIGNVLPRGDLRYKIVKAKGPGLSWKIRNLLIPGHLRGLLGNLLAPALAKLFSFTVVTTRLYLRVTHPDGTSTDYGLVSTRQVTTVGVTAMSTSFQTPASPGNFYYHGIGTGGGAEGAGNTALTTELTTEYNPDNVRPAGTHVAGGSANIYRSVGTVTIDSGTPAITEHGVFDSATRGAGNLLDRHLFSAVNMSSGDGFQATYEITFTAGG